MSNYLFTNGFIYDVLTGALRREALLVQDGVIAYLGDESRCRLASRAQPQLIDLKGRILLPAFTDCHTHFVEYAKSRIMVNLDSCNRLEDIITYLETYRDTCAYDFPWILGGGWDRNKLAEPHKLNRHLLDRIFPDKPVALMSKDYHSRLCNTLALKISGIDGMARDPKGGRIERSADGTCSGVLFETATEIIDNYLQLPSPTVLKVAIREAIGEIYAYGLAGFHTMESRLSCELLQQAQSEGTLFRLCWHFTVEEVDSLASQNLQSYQGDEFFKLGGMKIFGDGSLGSRTAAMAQPYSSEPADTGILRYTDAELFDLSAHAAQFGFASTIHAIGDRCVHQVLKTLINVQERYPHQKLFHRIEHLQSIKPEDIALLAQSGIFCSLQPVHLANDVPMIKTHWADIETEVYVWKSLMARGINPGFGSDAPIESINPMLGIYTALTRRPAFDRHQPAFHPEEALSLHQALAGYTLAAAMSSRSEAHFGSLELGKTADLMVLDDFQNQDSEFWLQARSLLTMIGGKIVHSTM